MQTMGNNKSFASKAKNPELTNQYLSKLSQILPQLEDAPDFPSDHEWLNTSRPLSLKKDLSHRLVVVDFWSSCCINCIHVLAEMTHL